MNLPARVRVLERGGAGAPCPSCGAPPPGYPLPRTVVIRIKPPGVFGSGPPGDFGEQPGDRCPACGRLVVLRVRPPRALREE